VYFFPSKNIQESQLSPTSILHYGSTSVALFVKEQPVFYIR